MSPNQRHVKIHIRSFGLKVINIYHIISFIARVPQMSQPKVESLKLIQYLKTDKMQLNVKES